MYRYPRVGNLFPFSFWYGLLGLTLLLALQSNSRPLPTFLPRRPAVPDLRLLPADVGGLPELLAQRTATTATFDHGDGRYTTIVSGNPMHYLDEQGSWQVIDPTFRPLGGDFVVEHNSLRSRAAGGTARVWLGAGGAAAEWQAQRLGVIGAEGVFVALAHVLEGMGEAAEVTSDGRRLRYTRGWSDPALVEELTSSAGALEQTLILQKAPVAFGEPRFLEMQATLRLLPGTSLWAEGKEQSSSFTTAGSLEIRDAAGEVALRFDPVVAFEQADRSAATAGFYTGRPGAEEGSWTIGVRTPWSWWVDPARTYPVVLDPTMHVLGGSGDGNGLAWIGDKPGAGVEPYRLGEIILGTYYGYGGFGVAWPPYDDAVWGTFPGHDSQAEGYLQFNTLPGLLQNSPLKIQAAYIDVEPLPYHMPYYKGSPDWEEKVLNWKAEMFYVGACPDACPGGFSVRAGIDSSNRPQGVPLAVGSEQTLTTDPLTKWKQSGWAGELHTTSWDVTAELSSWYDGYYTDPARPKPVFRLALTTSCQSPGPYVKSYPYSNHQYAPGCSALVIPAGNVRLRLEYQTLALQVGDNILNAPGVPGFAAGILADTAHEHHLSSTVGTHWRAVATRGNHRFLDPDPTPTRLGLQIGPGGSSEQSYLTVSPKDADETIAAFLDDHSSTTINQAELRALVLASDYNDLASDPDRNYRIEYVEAAPENVLYGTTSWPTIYFDSERLIELREFNLSAGDNLLIEVTAPVAIEPVLLQPTGATLNADAVIGTDAGAVNRPAGSGLTRTFEFGNIPVGDWWALAFINQEAPDNNQNEPDSYDIDVSLQRCPVGTIPTARYGCQPLTLPEVGVTPSRQAGGLTIYSAAGFVDSGSEWCSRDGLDLPPGTIPEAVIVGPAQNNRWMYVAQGKMCYIGGQLFTTVESAVGLAVPVLNPPPGTRPGRYVVHSFGSAASYPLRLGEPGGWVQLEADGRFVPIPSTRIALRPFEQYWASQYTMDIIYIDPAEMVTESRGLLKTAVTIAADSAPLNRDFDTLWRYYPQQEHEYQPMAARYHFLPEVDQQVPLPETIDLSSLTLRLLQQGSNAVDSNFKEIESYRRAAGPSTYLLLADYARITQAVELGGASQTVQVVANAPGKPLQPVSTDGEKSCSWQGSPTSCLDIRREDYLWQNGEGEKVVEPWELPDIHLEEAVGTLALATPGALTVFSADHPYSAADISHSFSFDTWDATVSVSQAPCQPGGPTTTVIKGNGFIALPTLGDDGAGGAPQIEVTFTLCQTELRTAHLHFNVADSSPPLPPIPIGSTGLGVTLIGGTVDIGPDSTKIVINLDFRSLDGQILQNGTGTLTVDTAGLFELQGSGLFLKGVVEADMTLQVAWNPFDMLIEGTAGCCYGGDLLSGTMRVHAWEGQGWQNKYPWLDDGFHFTGSISATLKIRAGDVVDEWPFVLPPFTVSMTAEVAFGEFCTNGGCTKQAWGASATVKVLGYSVGLYADSGGPSLILGSNGHKLVDQHCCASSTSLLQLQPATTGVPEQGGGLEVIKPGQLQLYLSPPIQSPASGWSVESCTNPAGSLHTCHFTVNPGTGRALFTVNWQNGPLVVELLKPDGTAVTGASAAAHGISYSAGTGNLGPWVSFAVTDPPGGSVTAGVWKLRLSGVTDATNYGLLFAAEPPAPTVSWASPTSAGQLPDGNGDVLLSWSATRGGAPLEPEVKAELFYVPLAQKPITPTVMAGNVISHGVSAAGGVFTWNLPAHGLAAGDYAVGIRLNDKEHGNGHVVSWAPGSIHFEDAVPPPAPALIGHLTVNNGLIVGWLRDNSTPDLAGYLVEYTIPDYNPDAPPLPRTRRVLPSNFEWLPVLETVRLGGLKNGWTTTVCVRAYDASGNTSACTPTPIRVLDEPEERLGRPDALTATPLSGRRIRLQWRPANRSGIDGYILNYAPDGCLVPGLDRVTEAPPPPVLYDGATHESMLGGLTPGQQYRFVLRAYNLQGDTSPPAVTTARLLNPADADGDELPDEWEALYQAFEADDDLDEDGLSNYEEYMAGTDPLKADGDFDGYYDIEELERGTDPCSALARPASLERPRLALAGPAAVALTGAVNGGPVAGEEVAIWNGGSGELAWSATSNAPWLTLTPSAGGDAGSLALSASPVGLLPGIYTAEITITATSQGSGGVPVETAVIPVTFRVLPARQFEMYLPVLRNTP